MCNLCSVTGPGQIGLVQSKLQPHGSLPFSDSPAPTRRVLKVCVGSLSHVVACLYKTAMSPNKSNSCSFRDSNISIMTSVFCLQLHNQSGEREKDREGERGRERESERERQRMTVACCGFCVGAATLEAANSGASDETVSGQNKRC